MLSLHCLSPPPLYLITNNKYTPLLSVCPAQVEKDSQQFEIDPDKAREALQKLDQQLQYLSQKQVTPPKIKASDVKLARDQTTEEEIPEFSGSFLAFVTAALFLFTIFYNIIYITVIEPSIDGGDPTPTTALESESPSPQVAAGVLQLLPLAPGT